VHQCQKILEQNVHYFLFFVQLAYISRLENYKRKLGKLLDQNYL